MKIKELTAQLQSFAQASEETRHLSEKDIEKIAKLIFRYLANLELEECISTINQIIKTGIKANQIEGKLKGRLTRSHNWKFWTWTQPIVNGFDSLWQEAANIFSPSSTKF